MAFIQNSINSERSLQEGEYKLYINNLPAELNAEGIRQIFQKYGRVTSLYWVNAPWAYITYGSYREAEHAIRDLNELGPLHLKVAFARDNKDASQGYSQRVQVHVPENNIPTMEANRSLDNIPPDFRHETQLIPHREHPSVHGLLAPSARRLAPQEPVHEFSPADDLLYPAGLDQMFDPYENAEPYRSTNSMWTRGNISIANDGRRHVKMGRGYTAYEIPPPNPKIEEYIGRVHQKRVAGLYEYGENKLSSSIGKCQNCGELTKMNCQRCHTFYCGRQCQAIDWPRHKVECQPMPPLVKGDIGEVAHSSNEELAPKIKLFGNTTQRALRRPNQIVPTPIPPNMSVAPPAVPTSAEYTKSPNPDRGAQNRSLTERLTDHGFVGNGSPNGALNQDSETNAKPVEPLKPINLSPKNSHHGSNLKTSDRQDTAFHKWQRTSNAPESNGRLKNYNKDFSKAGIMKQATNADSVQNEFHKLEGMNEKTPPKLENTERQMNKNLYAFGNRKQPASPRAVKNEIINKNSQIQNCSPKSTTVVEKETHISTDMSIKRTNELNFSFEKECKNKFISNTSFTKVRITVVVDNGIYWVQKLDDEKDVIEILAKLNSVGTNEQLKKVEEPILGGIYAATYQNTQYRAVLTSLNPKKIFFLDFGNEEELTSDLFELNGLEKFPPFAKRICLCENTSEENKNLAVDSIISVKMVKINSDGTITVQVEGDNSPLKQSIKSPSVQNEVRCSRALAGLTNCSTSMGQTDQKAVTDQMKSPDVHKTSKNSSEKFPSIIDMFTEGSQGCLDVRAFLNNDTVTATVILLNYVEECEKIINILSGISQETPDDPNFKPKVGDIVCGLRDEGDWLRGYVVSLGPPLRMAVIDHARVDTVKKFIPLPNELKTFASLGVVCKLLGDGNKLESKKQYNLQVGKRKEIDGEEAVEVLLTSDDEENLKALIKRWAPTLEQKGLSYVQLESGSEIYLATVRSQNLIYARSLKIEDQERSNRLNQEVAKYAQIAKPLTQPPVIGQLVLSKFLADNNYYRAIINKITEDGRIGVSYVDYGNQEFTTLENIKTISEELKEVPCCITKIAIKDVPQDIPMNKNVIDYLRVLVSKEQPLICSFDGIPSIDGVYLKMPNGESVNEKINELLKPSWEKQDPEKDTNCYMANDLDIAILGKVGDTVNAVVLADVDDPLQPMLGLQDRELLEHVDGIMLAQIADYIKTTTRHYIPRELELCLAPYKGNYYRALCIKSHSTPTKSTVFFVDYGNVEFVEHTDIRMITKDFITVKALANVCTIVNLCPLNEQGELPKNVAARLAELVAPQQPVIVKIIKEIDPGTYEIEVPEVKARLIAEGVIKC